MCYVIITDIAISLVLRRHTQAGHVTSTKLQLCSNVQCLITDLKYFNMLLMMY